MAKEIFSWKFRKLSVSYRKAFFQSSQTCNLIGWPKKLCGDVMMAQEYNKLKFGFCQWKAENVEYLQRSSVCSRKFPFHPRVPFTFEPVKWEAPQNSHRGLVLLGCCLFSARRVLSVSVIDVRYHTIRVFSFLSNKPIVCCREFCDLSWKLIKIQFRRHLNSLTDRYLMSLNIWLSDFAGAHVCFLL